MSLNHRVLVDLVPEIISVNWLHRVHLAILYLWYKVKGSLGKFMLLGSFQSLGELTRLSLLSDLVPLGSFRSFGELKP